MEATYVCHLSRPADLARWRAAIPDNFFACDTNLQRVLRMHSPNYDTFKPELDAFGQAVAIIIDPAAAINDLPQNHPRLDAWDGIGQRTEEIEFHPSYHQAGGRPMRRDSWRSRPSRATYSTRARSSTC